MAMVITPAGSTTTIWRPGAHQPCIVNATKVAVSHPAAIGSVSAAQCEGWRTTSQTNAGTSSSHAGCRAAMPNLDPTINSDSRRPRPR